MKPIERLYEYFDYKGIKPTAFEKEIGISNGYLGKAYRKQSNIGSDIIKTIVENCPDLNIEWFILGSGNMIKTKSENNLTKEDAAENSKSKNNLTNTEGKKNGKDSNKNQNQKESYPSLANTKPDVINETMHDFRLRTDSTIEVQSIPLYNIEGTAGLVPLFNDTNSQTPVDYINIPHLPKCDGAIHVTGDSMYPLLKSGDIVLYKQINDFLPNIFWGEMYLISIDMEGEEYVTVKYIQKSDKEDHIKLVSHNQHHSDKLVHIAKVRALAFVKASIRINSMK